MSEILSTEQALKQIVERYPRHMTAHSLSMGIGGGVVVSYVIQTMPETIQRLSQIPHIPSEDFILLPVLALGTYWSVRMFRYLPAGISYLVDAVAGLYSPTEEGDVYMIGGSKDIVDVMKGTFNPSGITFTNRPVLGDRILGKRLRPFERFSDIDEKGYWFSNELTVTDRVESVPDPDQLRWRRKRKYVALRLGQEERQVHVTYRARNCWNAVRKGQHVLAFLRNDRKGLHLYEMGLPEVYFPNRRHPVIVLDAETPTEVPRLAAQKAT